MSRLFVKLLKAQSNDDVEAVSQLLKSNRGWPIKNPAWSDHALLSEALQFGRKKVANHLLDLHCRVTRPGHLSTFVHMALKHSDWKELIAKLINLGAPVSTINAEGDTAVHVAFKNNADNDLIDLLLKTYVRETTWNIKDCEELSILHIACSRPNLKIVRALTHRKAQVIVTRKDVNGQVKLLIGCLCYRRQFRLIWYEIQRLVFLFLKISFLIDYICLRKNFNKFLFFFHR